MTPKTNTPPPRASALSRFGPLALIVVAVLTVGVLSSTGRDSEAAEETTERNQFGGADDQLPVQFSEAKADDRVGQFDFGEQCDTSTGRMMIPSNYSPPCVAARPGVQGGATYRGVTDDEITVVLYGAADDDLAASLESTADRPEDSRATREAFLEMLANTHETWGRELNIVNLKGSGSDETSARADAVKVAEEIEAFASIGGPAQESAYAEELARRGVLCIGCGLSVPDSTLQENAPFLWGTQQNPEQYLLNLGDFIIGQLVGRNAEFAGSEELREHDRVFGVVHFEQDPPVFGAVEDTVATEGGDRGYEQAVNLTYQLVISDLPEKARVLVARLKEAEVTTVIFLGDPIMPIYLTEAATDQEYFPEWIITGTVLTDTTVFGRMYDQRQWQNAFGLSSIGARTPPDLSEGWRLHQWYFGEPPVAAKSVATLYPSISHFMRGIHMAGPNLTPETFRDGLGAYPPSGGTPTSPRISYGDRGTFREPDFTSVDDMQIIWWDVDATGPDEQGTEGTGMVRYTDGGRRYLPGEIPSIETNVFQEEGSVTLYENVPPAEVPPDYPSPGPGGS